MRVLAVVLAICLAGCIRSGTTTCADGTICRDGTVCAPEGERTLCVTPEQISACAGQPERAACGADRCYAVDDGLVCLPKGCGNGFVDGEELEQCDDGNNASEDGCAADCLSNERCGNGVIDPLEGERCDDGNLVSHDGCSSRCDDEQPRWRERLRATSAFRLGTSMTFDLRRGRFVLFGGQERGPQGAVVYLDETLEADGELIDVSPTSSPPARSDAALAYDDVRGVTVMFGGTSVTGLLADTWEYTGSQWRAVDASGPQPRQHASLVYDPVHARTILFGGRGELEQLHDVWALENGTWSQLPQGPDGVGLISATFDPKTETLIFAFAGHQWELDGTTWTDLGVIPSTSSPTIMFEPRSGRRILVGQSLGQLAAWEWSGSAWTLIAAQAESARVSLIGADRARGGLYGLVDGVWGSWVPGDPIARTSSDKAEINNGADAVNDVRRARVIQFGGNLRPRSLPDPTNAMFEFDGDVWTELTPLPIPSARRDHAMAYDPVRDEVVLFGGETIAGRSSETWVWNGTEWRSVLSALSPSARAGHAMAFDPVSNHVVLFGGATAPDVVSDETWEWDGTTWTRRSGEAPPARAFATLAPDPIGGGLLLFGGDDTSDFMLGDTWRLTTAGWTRLSTVIAPARRRLASLTVDPSRGRLVLVGGERVVPIAAGTTTLAYDDTWEWDGGRWRALPESTHLVSDHVAFADPQGGNVMTAGGWGTLPATTLGTFTHEWRGVGAYDTCSSRLDADGDMLVGCADPDCAAWCTPLCLPSASATCSAPRCGDGTCSLLETPTLCPGDCGPPPVMCGDGVCDAAEVCPGDCP